MDETSDEYKEAQKQLETLHSDMAKPRECKLVVYPLPRTFDIEDNLIARLKLFGRMNVYSSSNSRVVTCVCESEQTAKDAKTAGQVVVDGQTFYIA